MIDIYDAVVFRLPAISNIWLMPFSRLWCVQYSSITVTVRLNADDFHGINVPIARDSSQFSTLRQWHPLQSLTMTKRSLAWRTRSTTSTTSHTLSENLVSWSVHIYLCAINRLRLCMFLIDSNGSSPIWLPDISKNLNDCVIELKLYENGENYQILRTYVSEWKMFVWSVCEARAMGLGMS